MASMVELSQLQVLAALGGGLLIGSAAGALALGGGKVMGCSGIAGGLLHDFVAGARTQVWRAWFLGGVLLGAAMWRVAGLPFPGADHALPALSVLPAGLLTGFGTRLGSGCTSGHGVCGIPRLSQRSLLAVALFMASGMLTVYLRHRWG